MTAQFALFVAGIAALVIAVILLISAAYYYISKDIRGVKDDLAGKTRAQETGRRGGRRAGRRRSSAPADGAPQGPANFSGEVGSDEERVRSSVPFQPENDLDTLLSTQLRRLPQDLVGGGGAVPVGGEAGDARGVPQATAQATRPSAAGDSQMPDAAVVGERQMPEDGVRVPDAREANGVPVMSSFIVTRNVLAIHSAEIISAG